MRQLIATQTRPIPAPDLRRITVPTALLWGRADRMVPIAVAEQASADAGWPLHVVEGAAHVPHMEQPDDFVRTLVDAMTPSGNRPNETTTTITTTTSTKEHETR